MCECVGVCMCVRACVGVGVGVWVCECVHVCLCACVCVCTIGVGGRNKREFSILCIYWVKVVPQGNKNRNIKNAKNYQKHQI